MKSQAPMAQLNPKVPTYRKWIWLVHLHERTGLNFHLKGSSEEKLSSVCLSTQTPPSVWKLEGWNFANRLLIVMPKWIPRGFSKILSGGWVMRFFYARLERARLALASIWGVCVQNFRPLASKLREENDVTKDASHGRALTLQKFTVFIKNLSALACSGNCLKACFTR